MYKFVYAIPDTKWMIIIGERHFYYNKDDKVLSWQMPSEVEVEKINFDQLGGLFGQAKGLRIDKKREGEEVEGEGDGGRKEYDRQEYDREEYDREEYDREEYEQETHEHHEVDEHKEEQQNPSLNLGYLSSDDSESEEHKQEIEENERESEHNQEEHSQEEANEESINNTNEPNNPQVIEALLGDILGEPVNIDTSAQFIDALNTIRPPNHYPYFLVEEEYINDFVKYPVFYQLKFKQKEVIFNQWCKTSLLKKYPSQLQLYLKELFNHKADVKTGYYADLASRFNDFTVSNKEFIFLNYKNLLHQQSNYERSYKDKPENVNLKQKRLREFLDAKGLFVTDYEPHGNSDWDKWINLCNDLNLPSSIAENEVNFVVGDNKRLHSYIEHKS